MNRKDRLEARLALAMLPAGALMTFVSVIAFIIIMLLIFATVVQRPHAATILLVWCAAALVTAGVNIVKSIETMSAFDWRALIPVVALSVVITAAYPGWWL